MSFLVMISLSNTSRSLVTLSLLFLVIFNILARIWIPAVLMMQAVTNSPMIVERTDYQRYH